MNTLQKWVGSVIEKILRSWPMLRLSVSAHVRPQGRVSSQWPGVPRGGIFIDILAINRIWGDWSWMTSIQQSSFHIIRRSSRSCSVDRPCASPASAPAWRSLHHSAVLFVLTRRRSSARRGRSALRSVLIIREIGISAIEHPVKSVVLAQL